LRVARRRGAEDMRMTLDHLLRDAVCDVVETEPTALGGERREKEDLEEEVAELSAQPRRISLVDGLERLVAFLEQQGPARLGSLLAVPGALAAQPFDERREALQGFGSRHAAIICSVGGEEDGSGPTC